MAELRLTYAQLATRLGISREAARQRAMRAKWRKVMANDGQALVVVDEEELEGATERPTDPGSTPEPKSTRTPEALPSTVLFERVLKELQQQLESAREQATRANTLEVERVRLEGEVRLITERLNRAESERIVAVAKAEAMANEIRTLGEQMKAAEAERAALAARPWLKRLFG